MPYKRIPRLALPLFVLLIPCRLFLRSSGKEVIRKSNHPSIAFWVFVTESHHVWSSGSLLRAKRCLNACASSSIRWAIVSARKRFSVVNVGWPLVAAVL